MKYIRFPFYVFILFSLSVLILSSCKKTNDDLEGKHPCDTIEASYTNVVQPILSQHCYGCHANGSASGGVTLGSYEEVVVIASDGRLSGAINHAPGFAAMPSRNPKLDSCKIFFIDKWIEDGMLDN